MAVQIVPAPSPAAEATRSITGEELFKMGDIGRTELIRGEIRYMSPTGYFHGNIETNFSTNLKAFVRQHKLGHVLGGEVGIYTHRNPDTVRAADVAFISNERMARVTSKSYLDVAPELVVEVLYPDDAWSDLMDNLDEYFSIGVKVVWVADPRKQQVYVYRAVTDVKRLGAGEVLGGEDVLPGFNTPVAELFAVE